VSALLEETAAKIRLEGLRRGDRVIVTLGAEDGPELMIVDSRIRDGATIGDARITVRYPGTCPAYIITAGQVAAGLAVTLACRHGHGPDCGNAAAGTCAVTGRPVCEQHIGNCGIDRYGQPPRAA
jgi:hypothetical protein